MRRAIRPAICRTSMRCPPASMPDRRLLVLEARLLGGGVEELARRCARRIRTTPLTGYRFTCTLKTFMKIETRIARAVA